MNAKRLDIILSQLPGDMPIIIYPDETSRTEFKVTVSLEYYKAYLHRKRGDLINSKLGWNIEIDKDDSPYFSDDQIRAMKIAQARYHLLLNLRALVYPTQLNVLTDDEKENRKSEGIIQRLRDIFE